MASMALTGTSSFVVRKSIHFLPEADGIAQFALRNLAQPFVVLSQNERQALLVERFAIAFEDGGADVGVFEGQASRFATARWALTARRTRSLV